MTSRTPPCSSTDAASKISDATIEQHPHAQGRPRAGGGLQVELGGAHVPGAAAAPGPAELIGILAAIIILLVAFGSVLAMGLPILIALFGIGIGFGLVQLLSHVIVDARLRAPSSRR